MSQIRFEVSAPKRPLFDINAGYVGWDIRKFRRGMAENRDTVMRVYQEEKGLSQRDRNFLDAQYPTSGSLLRVGLTKVASGEQFLLDGYMVVDAGEAILEGDQIFQRSRTPMIIEVVRALQISISEDDIDEDDVPEGEPWEGLVIRRTSYLPMVIPQGLVIKLEPEDVVEQLAFALHPATEIVRP